MTVHRPAPATAPLTIDGATRLFAIIGDPISAVRSPQYFNARFAERGLNAVMVPLHVRAEDLATAWAGLSRMRNLHGLVITMPHKVAACRFVDHLEETARIVGSINAARRDADGRWVGDMFDGRGCVMGLLKQGHEVAGRRAFLLGLGGAGMAIAAALAEASVAELVVHDLDTGKRDAAIARIAQAYPRTSIRPGNLEGNAFDFAINATPLGMKPADPLPFDPTRLPRSTVVVDVIPNPEITPLLERALARGHAVQTGRHMHEGQAIGVAGFFGIDLGASPDGRV